MIDLVMGPFDTIVQHCTATKTKIDTLRTLDALQIAEHVPMEGDIGVTDLASKLGLDADLVARMLKCGYLMSIFRETRKGHVAHTGVSAAMPALSPYIQMNFSPMFRKGVFHYPEAMKARKDGEERLIPVERADKEKGGRRMWQQLIEDDPDGKGMEKFSASMKALTPANLGETLVSSAHGFGWKGLTSGIVVDIGGGDAHLSLSIADKLPDRDFLVQDLETNVKPATQNIERSGQQNRVRFQVHDFFEPQPTELRPAAYILCRILHDWTDEDCVRIIRPLLPAMLNYKTKLFIVDRVLPDGVGEMSVYREWTDRALDVLMFNMYDSKERTWKDWERMLQQADTRLKITAFKQPMNVVYGFLEVELQIEEGMAATDGDGLT